MSERSRSRETIAGGAALKIVHRPDEREWLRGVRTRNRVGREPVGVLPALLNDPRVRVRTVAEKENDVAGIRQFSYRPTRWRITIIKSAQYHVLDFAGIAGGNVFSGRNYETGQPANAGCFF